MTVLFDGYCVLCSGFARWLHRRFRSAVSLVAMQSEKGRQLLTQYGYSTETLDEVIVVEEDMSVAGAPAVLYILKRAGQPYLMLKHILCIFPQSWIKAGYRIVAGNRYKWFGKRKSCAVIQD